MSEDYAGKRFNVDVFMLSRWICAKFRTCARANSMSLMSCGVSDSTQASISVGLSR